MKCPKCGKENKENEKFCVNCGLELDSETFMPDWKWHIKTLVIIYIVLGLCYFILKAFI